MADRIVTLYHSPRTRSSGVLALLEEIGKPYKLEIMGLRDGSLQSPAFRALNPMGKVPALVDDQGAVVTEQVAIFLHLADLFPEAGLAPAIGDPLRGPYLRWFVFYAASFEPAMIDKANKNEPGERGMSPYGEFDRVVDAVEGNLAKGPYMLGQRFSALDILWGSSIEWTMMFDLLPKRPVFEAYARAYGSRPAIERARAKDAAFPE